jgi:hypothetical protein
MKSRSMAVLSSPWIVTHLCYKKKFIIILCFMVTVFAEVAVWRHVFYLFIEFNNKDRTPLKTHIIFWYQSVKLNIGDSAADPYLS